MSGPTIEDLRAELAEAQERIRQLEEIVSEQRVVPPPGVHLTPNEMAILGVLIAREQVTPETLYTVVYGRRGREPPASNTMSVFVHRLRQKFRPHGLVIESIGWGQGYRLPPETKARLRALQQPPESQP